MLIHEKNTFRERGGLAHGLAFSSKAVDLVVIFITLYLAVGLMRPGAWNEEFAVVALIGAILFPLSGEVMGVYRPWWGKPIRAAYSKVLFAWVLVVFVLLVLGYFFKLSAGFSRLSVGAWMLLAPIGLVTWRHLARWILARVLDQSQPRLRVAIWGEGSQGKLLQDTLSNSPGLRLDLVEYIDNSVGACAVGESGEGENSLDDRLAQLVELATAGGLDVVYIAVPTTARARIITLIEGLSDTTVSVYMVPDYFTTQLFHGEWGSLNGIPIISVFDTPFWGIEGGLKRLQDVVLGSMILLLIALPMLVIALAVKLSSPGPVFFRQRRYGMDGKEIQVLKFRSMRALDDGAVVKQATRDDPRVTPLGAFMRRTSLDELPQFINVVKGDMSIVGPRPHAVAHNEEYRKLIKGYMLRHKVKPGITGWAQINGWRGETEELYKMQKRIEHDLWYIRNWTFWLDLKIILWTLVRGFGDRSAY